MTSITRARPSSTVHDAGAASIADADATLRCPSCNFVHRARTDVFGNVVAASSGPTPPSRDYDARIVYGTTATCPICIEECTDIVALRCGHVLCVSDYARMGGCVRGMTRDDSSRRDREDEDGDRDYGMLVHVRNAGQGGVNGTYRRHRDDDVDDRGGGNAWDGGGGCRYTSMGRYDGRDAIYCMELRVVDGGRTNMWYLSCHTCDDGTNIGRTDVDFYRGRTIDGSTTREYPHRVTWESASIYGTFPLPRVAISHFA